MKQPTLFALLATATVTLFAALGCQDGRQHSGAPTGAASPGGTGSLSPALDDPLPAPAGEPITILCGSSFRPPIEKLTEINGGRAFYTTNESLGDYVLVDFLEHRRR